MLELQTIVEDFARGIERADGICGENKNYGAGIGPFDEPDVVRFVLGAMQTLATRQYDSHAREVVYPGGDGAPRIMRSLSGAGGRLALGHRIQTVASNDGHPGPKGRVSRR